MAICEVSVNFDSYDEQTLSIVCPECNAAIMARCLGDKPGGMGGKIFLPAPHRNRVLKAHSRVLKARENKEESIWGF